MGWAPRQWKSVSMTHLITGWSQWWGKELGAHQGVHGTANSVSSFAVWELWRTPCKPGKCPLKCSVWFSEALLTWRHRLDVRGKLHSAVLGTAHPEVSSVAGLEAQEYRAPGQCCLESSETSENGCQAGTMCSSVALGNSDPDYALITLDLAVLGYNLW